MKIRRRMRRWPAPQLSPLAAATADPALQTVFFNDHSGCGLHDDSGARDDSHRPAPDEELRLVGTDREGIRESLELQVYFPVNGESRRCAIVRLGCNLSQTREEVNRAISQVK